MAAAYASLVSVMHTINELQQHPQPPISLHKQQLESITRNITFLQDFLENGGVGQEADGLESRIAYAAQAAADIIDSRIVDKILAGSTTHEEKTSGVDLDEGMQEVIKYMDSIKDMVMDLKQDRSVDLDEGLQEVIKNMDSIKDMVMDLKPDRSVDLDEGLQEVIKNIDSIKDMVMDHKPDRSVDLDEGLQEVIKDMDSIKDMVMDLKPDRMKRFSTFGRLSKLPSTQESKLMVGFDGILLELMDKLTQGLPLRLIPLVGMGGIGKTTLARYVYSHETVVQRFDKRAWATISQNCVLKEILLGLLNGLVEKDCSEELRDMNEHDLGDKLYKILFGRRYLIIMDDIWDIEVWEQLKFYFPNNNEGSKIVFTTRLSALAQDLSDSHGVFKLDFLNEDDSWNLFCKIVFGEEDCPFEMEEIGKNIVKSCRGLPLSIKVIGGLLSVSAQTPQNWQHIAENLSSVVNSDDNEHCLKVLYTSYNNLPVYLKPCFLYMGVFREDSEIHVSGLIKLWVAEGFLKPKEGRILEDVAEEYLGELVDRNLILVEKRNYCGKLKLCKIHDLLRDLSLREARKHNFFCVLDEKSNYYGELKIFKIYYLLRDLCSRKRKAQKQDLDSERHIWSYDDRKLDPLSVSKCLNLNHEKSQLPVFGGRLSYATDYLPRRRRESLLQHLQAVFQRVNLRYINLGRRQIDSHALSEFPSSIYLLWNLQTLVVDLPWVWMNDGVALEIWKMPRLRHVRINNVSELTSPPTDDGFVLENLQTLLHVRNFKCSKEVVKRIPNITKLKLKYLEEEEVQGQSRDYCLGNIGDMQKLTSLRIENKTSRLSSQMQSLTLPHSLKKLNLSETNLPWEDMTKIVGSLPLLEFLRLGRDACEGFRWVTNEGQFCSLKVLEINFARVVYWETEKEHFPRLERIFLNTIYLGEIPSCIGDIDTLRSFTLGGGCFRSARNSALKMKEEQEEFGNDTLQFDICSDDSTLDHILNMDEIEYESENWAGIQVVNAMTSTGSSVSQGNFRAEFFVALVRHWMAPVSLTRHPSRP